MHRHPIKDETFHLETGVVFLELGGEEFFLRAGDTMHIPAGTPHRFSGLEDSVILEFSTHHEDDDVIRESESGPIPADELAALQQRAG
ncbi:MAG: cupin domain-containing protein [Planctomycetota bacterium]|nr:cupin domain-containing protein [Planctomycetota bacterium]